MNSFIVLVSTAFGPFASKKGAALSGAFSAAQEERIFCYSSLIAVFPGGVGCNYHDGGGKCAKALPSVMPKKSPSENLLAANRDNKYVPGW